MVETNKEHSGSDNRRRTETIMVRVTKEEQVRLQDHARAFGLRTATYLRQVGLNNESRSRFDELPIRDLAQVHGDLGRAGELLKSWVSRSERHSFGRHLNIPQALGRLRQLQREVYRVLEKL